MTDYDKIQEDIKKCIDWLSPVRFSNGALRDFQNELNDLACCVCDINDAVRDIDERVTILEV